MKTALSSLAVLILVSSRASAELVVNDTFDTYENQTQFRVAWTAIATTEVDDRKSALLDIGSGVEPPMGGPTANAVLIPGTTTNGEYQNQLTFPSTPVLGAGDQIIWSFDYWDQLPVGNPVANYATLTSTAASSTSPVGQTISLGLNNNQSVTESGESFFMASVSKYSHAEDGAGLGEGVFFKLNDTAAGLRSEPAGWRNLKLVISTSDGVTVDHEYYVNNVLAETVTGVAPVAQYNAIRLGSGLANGNRLVRFDNMRLELVQVAAVPEAGAFAAVGLVSVLSAAAVWLRRRRTSA